LSHKKNVAIYLALSSIGAAFIILVSWLGGAEPGSIGFVDKLIVAGAFVSSCLFGISLAVRPGWTGRFARRGIHGANPGNSERNTGRNRRGHHPDCEEFESHRIFTKKKTYCAGCLGLSLGSAIAILLMVLYLVIPNNLPSYVLLMFVIIGLTIVALNYIEIAMSKRNPIGHVVSNAFLVVGFFLIIVGVFQLTGNALIGILGVIVSFLWLDARIQLSHWRHSEICNGCSETCKAY
jgi:hypothetical protein